MNKKLTPHIIAVTALIVFIALGLACASAPKTPPSIIPLPTLSELRAKNGENKKLVVIFNNSSSPGQIVVDKSSIARMRDIQNKMVPWDAGTRASWASNLYTALSNDGVIIGPSNKFGSDDHLYRPNRDYPCEDVAAFSLGNNVSEIGIYFYKQQYVGGESQPVTFYSFLYIPISDKKEQFYSITGGGANEITNESTINNLLSRREPHSYVIRGEQQRPREFIYFQSSGAKRFEEALKATVSEPNPNFFGKWMYKSDIFDIARISFSYTFSNDKLIVTSSSVGSYTVHIEKWESVVNNGEKSKEYPNGVRITGEIIEMTGGWTFGKKGDSYSEIFYINKNKNRIKFLDSSTIYVKQK